MSSARFIQHDLSNVTLTRFGDFNNFNIKIFSLHPHSWERWWDSQHFCFFFSIQLEDPMLCIWESYHWDSLGIHGKSAPDDEHPPWLQQQLSLRLAPISRANCGCISKCTGPVQWVISPSVSVKSWNSSGHFCCEHMLRVAKSVPTKPISPAGSVTVPGKNKIPWSNMTQLAGQSPTWTEFVGDFIVATSDGR